MHTIETDKVKLQWFLEIDPDRVSYLNPLETNTGFRARLSTQSGIQIVDRGLITRNQPINPGLPIEILPENQAVLHERRSEWSDGSGEQQNWGDGLDACGFVAYWV